MAKPLIFGEWPSEGVQVNDPGLKAYINLEPRYITMTQGRNAKNSGKRAHIVERLMNNLMRGGTGKKIGGHRIQDRCGCGQKTKAYKFVKSAFTLIKQKTNQNPIEVLVRAIENAAPREETTRVKMGGMSYAVAVDVAPQRRVDFALHNIGKAVIIRSFNNKKSAADALSEELVLAAKNDVQSHAIARKIEIERIAKSSR